MKTYYQDEYVTIYHGDCREMRELASGMAQAVVTSPPFNAGKDYELDLWSSLDDYYQFLRDAFDEVVRILRPGGWCIAEVTDMHISPEHPHALVGQKEQSNMATSAILISYLMQSLYYKGEAIWARGRWTNNMAKRLECAPGSPAILVQHSTVQFFRKPGGRVGAYQYPQLRSDLKTRWCRSVWDDVQPDYNRNHPAVMPFEMAMGILQCWTLPSDEPIVEPFMGSGTTPAAAKKLGRKCIAYETVERYCEIAANRCRQMVFDLGI